MLEGNAPVIAIAKPSDFAEIRALVVEGLTQRWHRYDPALNPDLESFEAHYASALVLVAKRNHELVGCGALFHETSRTARIVRMSVALAHQRQGVGTMLLNALLEEATSMGYKKVRLETTVTWVSAVAFYTRRAFFPTIEHNGNQHFYISLPSGRAETTASAHAGLRNTAQ